MSEKDGSKPSNAEAAPGWKSAIRFDALSGFLVFLIALPLCLAIAKASGYPPIAGIITAVVGGIIPPLISNSELTIKGPAAGLIAIVAGCVAEMEKIDPGHAYQYALAVGVVAAAIQIAFGLFRAGVLADFFPSAAVHGLLASIGVMILFRQFLIMLGVSPKELPVEPRELMLEYHHHIVHLHPLTALVGIISLAMLVTIPFLKIQLFKKVPMQLIVLVVTIPLALWLHFGQEYHYTFLGHEYAWAKDEYLIKVPTNFVQSFAFPNFEALRHPVAWKWVGMFAVIASLESLLSAKAVDTLDPYKRKTDLNRDILGCGIANLVSSAIGGLPMISEIVRSRANVDNGAKTRMANVFHGLFLLLFAALLPSVLNLIPSAALAAMLVFTGFRLAHPREFIHVAHIGFEQLFVFVGTIVAVVSTDLLIGVLIGMALELVINLINGTSPRVLFIPDITIQNKDEATVVFRINQAAVFTNWIGIRRRLESLGLNQNKNVVVDLSATEFVDHTVMEKLHEFEREFERKQRKISVIGLEHHRSFSSHAASARKRILYAAPVA